MRFQSGRQGAENFFLLGMDTIPEFYPDSDDTYLLIDSLEQDIDFIKSRFSEGARTIEVGSGGGLVSKSFIQLLRKNYIQGLHWAVDVNRHAAEETAKHIIPLGGCDLVIGDMFTAFRQGECFEVIFCNPPYVPSSPINRARDIRASYAGGERGREFIDEFLAVVATRLAPNGVFYFLLEHRNDISEVLQIAEQQYGLESTFVRDRKIRGEHLFVFRFTRKDSFVS